MGNDLNHMANSVSIMEIWIHILIFSEQILDVKAIYYP